MLASRSCNDGRLFYIENCIRFLSPKTHFQREFWQAGAELIGEGGVEADGEVIALALECLERTGLSGAKVDVGSISVFRKATEQFSIADHEALKRAVSAKSIGELREATKNERALEIFTYMTEGRGGPEVIQKLTELGVKDLVEDSSYFEELFDVIRAYGYSNRVRVDLSTLREMKYYNGVVFEIFLEGLGLPIGGGGRYDAMMKEFGLDMRATGFAVSVDLLVRALEGAGAKRETLLPIYYTKGFRDNAINLAKSLRGRGKVCTVSPYRGEKEGVLVGRAILDLKTNKVIKEESL